MSFPSGSRLRRFARSSTGGYPTRAHSSARCGGRPIRRGSAARRRRRVGEVDLRTLLSHLRSAVCRRRLRRGRARARAACPQPLLLGQARARSLDTASHIFRPRASPATVRSRRSPSSTSPTGSPNGCAGASPSERSSRPACREPSRRCSPRGPGAGAGRPRAEHAAAARPGAPGGALRHGRHCSGRSRRSASRWAARPT